MDPSYFYFSVSLSPSSFCEDPRSFCHGLGGDPVTHRGEEGKVQGTENRCRGVLVEKRHLQLSRNGDKMKTK